MRRFAIGLAAIGVLLTAVPAFAQVELDIGRRGVGVEVERRDGDIRRDDFRRDREVEVRRVSRDDDRRSYRSYRSYRSCRTIIVRRMLSDGTRIVRRIRRC